MSAFALRIFACVCMLLDHLGYCFPKMQWLRYVGRLAFPIYVFLIVNGYTHSSNRLFYALRLAALAVLSQVPFTLFCHFPGYFHNFNVFFSLLCALLTVWATDGLLKHRLTRWISFLPWLIMTVVYFYGYLHADYGIKAIWMAMTFRYLKKSKALTVLGCFLSVYAVPLLGYVQQLVVLILGRPAYFIPLTLWTKTQVFSLLALIPIFLYNGKRGCPRTLGYFFYAFYPAHLIILYLIKIFK